MLDQSLLKKLISYAGRRITEMEIRELVQNNNYDEYYQVMVALIQDNVIEPVWSSGSNGMSPPLYKRYRVIRREEVYDEFIPEIRRLHPALNIEGYLNQPQKYVEHREFIIPLDVWLKANMEALKVAVSINERSFQVFQQEKALKADRELAGALSFNQGIRSLLNYYDTPEPFFSHNIVPYSQMGQAAVNVLISENKDTWYTLRRLMNPSSNALFGIPFQILLYGEGKKINRKNGTLTDYDKITLDGFKSTYYYVGDMDYEGIGIYNELVILNQSLDIQLMLPLYREMLVKSQQVSLPYTKEQQLIKDLEGFLSFFTPGEQVRIQDILSARQYIPQEIVSAGDFIQFIMKGEDNV